MVQLKARKMMMTRTPNMTLQNLEHPDIYLLSQLMSSGDGTLSGFNNKVYPLNLCFSATSPKQQPHVALMQECPQVSNR